MSISQITEVISALIGKYATTTDGGSGLLYGVYAFVHMFHPSNHAFYDSTGILRFFVLLAFVGLGLGLFKRLLKSN